LIEFYLKRFFFTLLVLLFYSQANAQTALEFNGSNNKVTTTIDADRQAMPRTTWSAWIKPHGALTHWQMVVSMEDGGWDRFIAIEPNSNGLSMGMTSNHWQTGASATAGSWQHVVAIYDNGAMRFYYNGNEYTTNLNELYMFN
jgi:hypothetical protein